MASPTATGAFTRRRVLGTLAGCATAVALRGPAWGQSSTALPPELRTPLVGAGLRGQVRFRWLGIHVYDARLWSRDAVVPDTYADGPFGLELIYARRLEGMVIADRSIDEMHGQAALAPSQRESWRALMREAFPDVQAGDRLTGLHRPDSGASFFHNGRATRQIADSEFSQRFFGIWLSARSSQPALRQALLGERS